MDRERERLGLGRLWGPHRAARETGRVCPILGPSCLRPPAQVGTPSATARRLSATRQSHAFSVHRGTALISPRMASPFSRGTSACFQQPSSIFQGK